MFDPFNGDFTPTSISLVDPRRNHICWDVEAENVKVKLT